MSYISLYRKYRPHTFADVVGQDIVIKILKNSIINDKINHAYIFSGPRGTGKTSVAKIFAKAVNCLNKTGDICNECDICKMNIDEEIDIVEIDAASNNGVEEIREIRNNIKMLPTILKYKVYIIDEVHMLSTSAFNALLKTLEEPPAHAIFILATTEINKIPTTVLSRCQKFDFKKLSVDEIFNRLKYICNNEKITIDDDVLTFISELSDGGLRDAINLLDQVNSFNKKEITQTDVLNLIGNVDDEKVYELLDNIFSGNLKEVINNINLIYKNNKNFSNLIDKTQRIIKDIIIFNNTDNYFDKKYEDKLFKYSKIDINLLIKISEELFSLNNELRRNNNQLIAAEIYFIKITLLFKSNEKVTEKSEVKEKVAEEKLEEKINIEQTNQVEKNTIDNEKNNIIINNALCTADKKLKIDFVNKYESINDYITSKEYNSIASLLKKCVPEVVSEKNIIFTCENDFEIILFNKNIEEIVAFLKHLYGNKYEVVAIDKNKWKNIKDEYIKNIKLGVKYEYIDSKEKKSKSKKKNTELENSIENIFGEEYIIEE